MHIIDTERWRGLDAKMYPILAEQYVHLKFPKWSTRKTELEGICDSQGAKIIEKLLSYRREPEKEHTASTLIVGDSQFLAGILAVNEVLSKTEQTIRRIIIYWDRYNSRVNPSMIQEAQRIDPNVADLQQSHTVLIQKCIDDIGLRDVSVRAIDFLPIDSVENTWVISAVRKLDPQSTHFQILTKSFHAYRQQLMLQNKYPGFTFEMLPYEIPEAEMDIIPFDKLDRNVQILLAGEYDGVRKLEEGTYS